MGEVQTQGTPSPTPPRLEAQIQALSLTFYERFLDAFRMPYPLGSIAFGGAFLLVHVIVARRYGVSVWADRSVFLGPLIALYLTVVVSATRSLRSFLARLAELAGEGSTISAFTQQPSLKLISNTKNVAACGILAGTVCAAIGVAYGHWYQHGPLKISLFVQHVVYGGIGGIGGWGIWLVTRFVRSLDESFRTRLNYFSPDNCGGTGLIGGLLFRFAMYCLLMAFLTGAYIWSSPWTHRGQAPLVEALAAGVVGGQVLASVIVFAYPVLRLHGFLADYKREKHEEIRRSLRRLAERLQEIEPTIPDGRVQLEAVVGAYRQHQEHEKLLLQMNTWPYDVRLRLAFFGSLISPVPVSALAETIRPYLRF
ncbi:MAG TPA: hypothetical protein VI078_01055 [bacterium]